MSLPDQFRGADGLLDGARCVFVIGAPRSGTTWLQRMIEAHPSVASIPQELTLFSRYLDPIVKAYAQEEANIAQGRWKQGLPLLWSRERFDGFTRLALSAAYEEVIKQNPQGTILLDKHPGYCFHLSLLEQYLPGCRVIHIIRDGREVAVSMLSAKERIGFGASSIQGCAIEWADSVKAARAHGALIGPQRYMELRYEQLVERTADELARVLAFCGLPADDDQVRMIAEANHISRKAVSSADPAMHRLRTEKGESWSTKLDVRQRFWFNRIAGAQLTGLGYAKSDWWAFSLWEKARMALFPLRVRLGESIRALKRIWSSPITRQVRP